MNEKPDTAVDVGAYGPSDRSLNDRIDRDLAKRVNHLIRLGHDLVGAYETAIARLDSHEIRESMAVLQSAHLRCIEDLSEQVFLLGAEPAQHGDARSVLEKGRVVIATLRGDRGIVDAMMDNEADMMAAYAEAARLRGLPQEIRDTIAATLADQGRIEAVYGRLRNCCTH